MSLKVGNTIPRRLYKGSSLVNRVYKGDTLQWERLMREGRSFVSPTDGEVSLDTIYGKSLVWNQLASNGAMIVTNCSSRTFDNGYTTLILTNGTTIVRMASGYAQNGFHPGDKILVISHVKQYNVSNAPFSTLRVTTLWNLTKGRSASSAVVEYMREGVVAAMHTIASNVELTDRIGFYFDVNGNAAFEHTTSDTIVASYNIFNLTKMFGVGNEPSTVEEFEALFPDSYYPYDAGSVLSLGSQSNAIDIAVKGFNLWDEEWELGGLDSSGQNDSNPNRLRSKNYIECIGGGQYYFYSGGSNSGTAYYYDADKNFISSDTGVNRIITVPTNAAFLRFYIYKSGITTYANDICINISNPTYNGQYKPYQQEKTVHIPLTTLTSNGDFIFTDGVCGIGTVCDEVGQSKVIKRIGSRPYTAGDEGDSSVMTDGAVTRYVLTSPIEYPLDIPFKVEYKIAEGGSESLVGLTAPIKEDIALNYK